jgi:hypothetical protein
VRKYLRGVLADITERVSVKADRASVADVMPGRLRTFLEDSQTLDVRHKKGQLRTIFKTAHVYRDGRVELEFRI